MAKYLLNRNSGIYSIAQIGSYFFQALQTIKQQCSRRSMLKLASLFLVGVSLSIAIAACSGSNANLSPKPDVKLKLVSYSVTKAAYDQIIPKFVAKWQKENNQKVTIEQSYGASGPQARAVVDGSQEADVVHLSLALDTYQIVQAGLIKPGWERKAPKGGIVSRSVVALVTREGNPKGINSWEDLAKDGVKVITANPKTSGGARWNFLALWGAVIHTGGDEARAQEFIAKVFKNAPVLPTSAREAADLFYQQGEGDVLINYENEVILSERNGPKLPFSVPDVNISIDNPVAIVDKNVDKHGTRKVAEAFVEYLYSTEAQREFAKLGFRPVNPTVAEEVAKNYPQLKTLFTVQDLGGWDSVQNKFFGDGGLFDRIQNANKV